MIKLPRIRGNETQITKQLEKIKEAAIEGILKLESIYVIPYDKETLQHKTYEEIYTILKKYVQALDEDYG